MKPKELKKRQIKFYWVKVVILLISAIMCIIGVFTISNGFSKKANDVRKLKEKELTTNASNQSQILISELARYENDINRLKAYFPDEDRILDFIVQIDELKKTGVIVDFDFTSEEPVKDNLGLFGFPVSVTLTGDQEAVNQGLTQVDKLPFLIRPVILNVTQDSEGKLQAKYGGFVYVDTNFGKTR